MMKKALLITEKSSSANDALYEDYSILADFTSDILNIDRADATEKLDIDVLKKYQLVVLTLSSKNYAGDKDFIIGLYEYVLTGGSLLCIGEGTDASADHALSAVIGAKYLSKKPFAYLEFMPAEQTHPLGAAASAFIMDETSYRFEWSPYAKRNVILQHSYGALTFPTMWTTTFGKGKSACLTIQATQENMGEFALRALVYNSVLWLCNENVLSEMIK